MTPHHDVSVYGARLKLLGQCLGEKGIAFIPGARIQKRNNDVDYPFRQESNMLYLLGFNEPDALLVVRGGHESDVTLFCRERDPVKETWTGPIMGTLRAIELLPISRAFSNTPNRAMNGHLKKLLEGRESFYLPQRDRDVGSIPFESIVRRYANKKGLSALVLNVDELVGEHRLIKDDIEIATMRHAATISANAFREILPLISTCKTEYELESEFTHRFRRAGGDPLHAYAPIIAGGMHACTLHHTTSNSRLHRGDLVLIDAGCEYGGYASDITRTFPICGTFSRAQRAIYDVVLRAQKEAIIHVRAGKTLDEIHGVAAHIICGGLIDLGIIEADDPAEALCRGLHLPYFPHGTSHFLGLDVHDPSGYKSMGGAHKRKLSPGIVITIEPGLYFPDSENMPKEYRGIGVRIEDDVLVTDGDPTVLTHVAPKEVHAIEEFMQN